MLNTLKHYPLVKQNANLVDGIGIEPMTKPCRGFVLPLYQPSNIHNYNTLSKNVKFLNLKGMICYN